MDDSDVTTDPEHTSQNSIDRKHRQPSLSMIQQGLLVTRYVPFHTLPHIKSQNNPSNVTPPSS